MRLADRYADQKRGSFLLRLISDPLAGGFRL